MPYENNLRGYKPDNKIRLPPVEQITIRINERELYQKEITTKRK